MLSRIARLIEGAFLPIALAFSGLALAVPGLFTWIAPYISPALGIIMFGMGLSLTFEDFAALFPKWRLVGLGVLLQFTIMPGVAWLLTVALGLPPETALGVILVGACPGGTASNVITYLAGGNLALSVTLTLATTLLAPLATPALVALLGGRTLAVDFGAMVGSVFWIVAFPVVDGLLLRRLLRRRLEPLLAVFPSVSILVIALVIACVVGLNRDTVLAFPGLVMLAVVLHNGCGFALGYAGARLFAASRADCIAIAVEVGMQNSGLGVALAKTYFTPMVALPSALFSLEQNLAGVTLAKWWRRGGKQARPPASCPGD
ncbi:Bile acid:sodium symporter [Solidesulfovibrio carbinoliphilus subsp. oakridgensis]|uniref:Bile acid:sodium symporter n=1 Tax=Solidesulfovibrio carbinoliphilus subsp. oakridgensis TaxID=694327 RepID=G7QB10_9BACT|nr:bile acid:sodium symporter family protein [Solidesulfovibrio carbinoliphilus]EHJ48351.1 Bile acid:sodium symporter [Solidesulfovibrio carbinoliphilus subsp. oakridgensis]